jgi:hypothetical protein
MHITLNLPFGTLQSHNPRKPHALQVPPNNGILARTRSRSETIVPDHFLSLCETSTSCSITSEQKNNATTARKSCTPRNDGGSCKSKRNQSSENRSNPSNSCKSTQSTTSTNSCKGRKGELLEKGGITGGGINAGGIVGDSMKKCHKAHSELTCISEKSEGVDRASSQQDCQDKSRLDLKS